MHPIRRCLLGWLLVLQDLARAGNEDGYDLWLRYRHLPTPASLPMLATLKLPLSTLGKEGYLLRHTRLAGKRVTLIAANSDIGLLYGAYAWLHAATGGQRLDRPDERCSPALQLRLLNHWDNPDRHVERGYAGQSIWTRLPTSRPFPSGRSRREHKSRPCRWTPTRRAAIHLPRVTGNG